MAVAKLDPYYNYIYVEFNMLVDTDYGLIRYINENFADERVFMLDILDEDEKLLKGLLKERDVYNPLVVPANREIKLETLNALYKQFMDSKRNEIIMVSCVTSIYDLCKRCIESDSFLYITVICNDQFEKTIADEMFKNFSSGYDTIVKPKNGIVDVSKAHTLIVKHPTDLYELENVDGKNIYLADLECNIDQKVYTEKKTKYPNIDGALYFESNNYKFITMYPYNNDYSINDNYEIDDEEYDEDEPYPFEYDEDLTEEDIALLKEWLPEEELRRTKDTSNYSEEEYNEDANDGAYNDDFFDIFDEDY